MASNKKPSIYSDRSNVGSVEELDEYGVWIKGEPQIVSKDTSVNEGVGGLSSLNASADEFPDIEFSDDTTDNQASAEMDLDDFNIDDSDITGFNESTDSIGDTSVDNSSFEDLNVSSNVENEQITETNENISDKGGSSGADFDIPTVKSIENNVDKVQDNFEAATKNGDLSTQLLLKIANELSSIRGELQDLKKEFSVIRSSAHEEDNDEAISLTGDELNNIISSTEDGVEETGDKASGFFSEEDDESISLTGDELNNIINSTEEGAPAEVEGEDEALALTGDELDNIVNSADFTEESGTNETPENDLSLGDESSPPLEDEAFAASADMPEDSSEDISLEDVSLDVDDIDLADADLGEPAEESLDSEAPAEAEAAVEDANDNLNLNAEDLDINIDTAQDSDELEKLRNEGATPVTFAPDNISYLEEDDEHAADSLDLSDAVIDEPELSTENISDNLTEPSLDETELDLDSLDDLTIDDADLSTGDDLAGEPEAASDDLSMDDLSTGDDLAGEPEAASDDLSMD
ncbi:MAG: hypothetical protein FWF68_04015, partial [Spirochaetes bacterium]|nr:hypothetical protein [Spirochaetota bacterium]